MKIFLTIFLKELLGFFRSFGLVFVVLYFFIPEVYIAATGMEIEAKNVSVGIVDKSAGGISKKIISNLHKPEFQTPKYFKSQKELSNAIFNRKNNGWTNF